MDVTIKEDTYMYNNHGQQRLPLLNNMEVLVC